MEKRRPHYDLKAIQVQMHSVAAMQLTMSARHGIKRSGLSLQQAWQVIQSLTSANFYKSMTVHVDHRIWQDVYHARHHGTELYLKFQQLDDYFVISFKELDDE